MILFLFYCQVNKRWNKCDTIQYYDLFQIAILSFIRFIALYIFEKTKKKNSPIKKYAADSNNFVVYQMISAILQLHKFEKWFGGVSSFLL